MRISATLIAGMAAISVCRMASAADMPLKAPAPVHAAGYNWSGFYAGLNAGAAFGHAKSDTSTVFDPAGYFALIDVFPVNDAGQQTADKTGFTGGIQAGFNWQINNLLLGVETDFGALSVKTSATSSAIYPAAPASGFTIIQNSKTDWLWTLRPRIGMAANNWLLYVTGGLAVARIKGEFNFSDTFATAAESASVSKTKAGWVLGGGLEYGIADHWSVRGEYLHVGFDSISTTSTNLVAFGGTPFPVNPFTHSIKISDDIVRIGLNYRL